MKVTIGILADTHEPSDQVVLQSVLSVLTSHGVTVFNADIKTGDKIASAATVSETPTPAPRKRGRPAANGAATPAPVTAPEPDDDPMMPGQAATQTDAGQGMADDLNGGADEDQLDDDMGLGGTQSASLSPAEMLEQSLGKIREWYAKGHRKEVKDLQNTLKVTKFSELSAARGPEVYKLVTALEAKLG